jgi:phosphomevalonate decarboxylase
MKATAVAHPIQGLIKYHGLKDPKRRIPFHDSISVCLDALSTTTTVEADETLEKDLVTVNGLEIEDRERIGAVLDTLKAMADYHGHFKVVSRNSVTNGKGLGFSASGFAALGLAASASLDMDIDHVSLCETVRLGAGSATRSLAGGFALWYANRDGRSYAEQMFSRAAPDMSMVVAPIPSTIRTDEAHIEVLGSPLFEARLKNIARMVESMKKAIEDGDIPAMGRLAEEDTLNLHAITMTGRSHIVLWEPATVQVIKEVVRMRQDGAPVWYSMDTGPSVFVNTFKEYAEEVAGRLTGSGLQGVAVSCVGGKPRLSDDHLF